MPKKNKSSMLPLIVLIAVALIIAVVTGNPGLNIDKLAGILLALIVVMPVFLMLIRAARAGTEGNTKSLIKIFVGGFLYKLVILLVGIWIAVKLLQMDVTDFTVSCLAVMFAVQISESLYFKSNMTPGDNTNK